MTAALNLLVQTPGTTLQFWVQWKNWDTDRLNSTKNLETQRQLNLDADFLVDGADAEAIVSGADGIPVECFLPMLI